MNVSRAKKLHAELSTIEEKIMPNFSIKTLSKNLNMNSGGIILVASKTIDISALGSYDHSLKQKS